VKLHYAEVLNPRKVCALAKYVEAPVTFVHVDLAKGAHVTPAFRALNPNGRVPLLEDGENVIWEADAILCHLARRMDSDLWPGDARQVDVIRWLSWNQVHFQRFGGAFYFEHVIKAKFGTGAPDAAKIAAATSPFRTFARVLDDHLAGRAWLVGEAPTIADFSVAALLPYAEAARLPLDDCPAILRWHDRLNAFSAWRDPFPVRAG
jgi:glutathione S-transferase